MKTLKEFRIQINEVLKASDPIEKWIDDFVHSKNPKFAGKSTKERIEMAKGAYYAKQKNESAAISQNSTEITDMNEDHLVHVSDGSKYDEQPHDKDVEHVMAGVKLHGGQHAGASDKGVFFKFKSPEHAQSFAHHVNKCPHRSCSADLTEAVEYKGIGTDVVDKKKVLNPPIPLTQKKKEVKDFKEEVEQIDEEIKGSNWNGGHLEGRNTKYANKEIDAITAHKKKAEEAKKKGDMLAYHKHMEAHHEDATYFHRHVDDSQHHADEHEHGDYWGHERAMRYHMHKADRLEKKKNVKEEAEQIDEISKKTLGSYVKKASHDARMMGQIATDFENRADKARLQSRKDSNERLHKKYLERAWKRDTGISKAVDRLTKEETQLDELNKSTYQSYRDKASKDVDRAYDIHQNPYKKTAKDDMRKLSNRVKGDERAEIALKEEDLELIAKHEVKADAPHKSGGHVILTKSSNKWHVLHNKKSSPEAKDLHRSKLLHSYNDEKEARAKFKELKEEQIDEISKSTLMRYIPKASRDVGSYTYAGKEAGEHASQHTRAGDWEAAEKKTKKSYADFKKANKRIAGIDLATKKLGTQKEEVELDEASHQVYDTKTQKVHSTHDTYKKAVNAAEKLNKSHEGYETPGNIIKAKFGARTVKEGLDEAIAKKLPVQHAVDAVHATLGPKSATRFLSHLKPGTDKHTSWDKVNSALVKQGVQTRHIASIAQKTSHMNEEVNESRGHKVLATFFKNREVAQRAYQGNPAKDAEVAQGGGTPADQGIAAAKKDAEELKKKVSEAKTPAVHAAEPKKTKSTPKEYASAAIPGTKRVAHAKPDNNEAGGGTATRITEDQYAADYKIKYYVDPITGENKQRKIRPHRVNFANSKMRGEPAQADAQGDYGMKESYIVEGGFDNYHEIAKELIKRHGKNIDTSHINDLAGERDTHRGLDHSEVMHHVKKILSSKEVKEGDEYDEMWKEYKGKTFKKESRMLNFNDYLKEAKLSAKQKKIAAIAGDKEKIDADDLAALRAGKKPVEEASCSDKYMKKEELVGNQHKLDKNKNGKLDAQDFKMLRKEEAEQLDELSKDTLNSYVKGAATDLPRYGNTLGRLQTHGKLKDVEKSISRSISNRHTGIGRAVDRLAKEEVQIDEGKMKDIYTDMMDHATKKGYSSHKEFTPADYETVGKQHGISGKELAVLAGHKTAQQVANEAVDTVKKDASGKVTSWSHEGDWKKTDKKDPAGKVANLAGQALKKTQSLSKEEVERIEEKLAQLDELSPATLKSYKKGITRDLDRAADAYPHGTGDDDEDRKLNNRVKGDELASKKLKAKGVNPYSEEVEIEEATTRKDFQMVADLIKGHESAEKRKELATHHAGIFAKQNPRFDHAKFMKAAGVNEEVEQEMTPYLKATLSFMDESKYDDYKDALRAKKATQSAYDKNFKPDTTHPHIQVVKGTQYGGENQKDDEGDEKPEAEKEKRGRGRPSGSKSGARLKGGGHEDGGIPVHNLHLPKSYK